jgi:hypothetical protein
MDAMADVQSRRREIRLLRSNLRPSGYARPQKGPPRVVTNGDPGNQHWHRGGDRRSVATESTKLTPWRSYLGTRVASLNS